MEVFLRGCRVDKGRRHAYHVVPRAGAQVGDRLRAVCLVFVSVHARDSDGTVCIYLFGVAPRDVCVVAYRDLYLGAAVFPTVITAA